MTTEAKDSKKDQHVKEQKALQIYKRSQNDKALNLQEFNRNKRSGQQKLFHFLISNEENKSTTYNDRWNTV